MEVKVGHEAADVAEVTFPEDDTQAILVGMADPENDGYHQWPFLRTFLEDLLSFFFFFHVVCF